MKRVLALCAIVLCATGARAGDPIAYPDGYRAWMHVKSLVLLPGHPLENPFAGIHHVYANQKAAKGLTSGAYADGSVLVFDLLNYEEADHAGSEGPRKLVGVMQRDAKRFASTDGWGYEAFKGDSRTERLVSDGGASCHGCHASQKEKGYVFSVMR